MAITEKKEFPLRPHLLKFRFENVEFLCAELFPFIFIEFLLLDAKTA